MYNLSSKVPIGSKSSFRCDAMTQEIVSGIPVFRTLVNAIVIVAGSLPGLATHVAGAVLRRLPRSVFPVAPGPG